MTLNFVLFPLFIVFGVLDPSTLRNCYCNIFGSWMKLLSFAQERLNEMERVSSSLSNVLSSNPALSMQQR